MVKLSEAPIAPPGRVFVTAASATSLLVSCSSVAEQHRHGDIIQYNIYINLANKQNDSLTVPAAKSLVVTWRSIIYLQQILLTDFPFIENYAPVFKWLKSKLDIVFFVLLNQLHIE